MAVKNKVLVDPIRFRKATQKRNLKYTEISKKCGYGPNTVSGWLYEGYFPEPMALLLKSIYNIDRSEYEPVVSHETPEPTEKPVKVDYEVLDKLITEAVKPLATDYERLYKVIYSATYEAVRKAWGE